MNKPEASPDDLTIKNINEDLFLLSDIQKKKILDRCNAPGTPPSLKDLCMLAFGPGVDGRDKRSRLIKEFCGEMNKPFRVSYTYYKESDDLVFTDEQQELIKNHIKGPNPLKAYEIARILWADGEIGNLDHRCRAVQKFIENQPEFLPSINGDDPPEKEYQPPVTLQQACYRANKYVRNAVTKDQLEKDTRVRKNLECLISFCHNPRFLALMNSFETVRDRALFESSYIRYLYNIGEDVTQVDVDAYLSLCLEVMNRTNLQRELEKLNKMRDDSLNSDQRLSMSIVEMIGKIHAAIDNTEKRQGQLRQSLEGNRSKRVEQKLQSNQSVLQLVEAWRQEEKRKRMIKIAERRREILKDEVQRLDNLDELKIEIYGLDPEAY